MQRLDDTHISNMSKESLLHSVDAANGIDFEPALLFVTNFGIQN